MMTTDEIVAEYKSLEGARRRGAWSESGYIHDFGVDDVHVDCTGDKWYTISVFVNSLDRWLWRQCKVNDEQCSTTYPHFRYDAYPRYYIHGSLLSFITLRWK